MMKLQSAACLSALMFVPMIACADWSGKGELGAADSTANTGARSTTLAAKFDLADQLDQWKHAFGASTVYTTARDEASADEPEPVNKTSARRWEAHEQSDYNFSPRAFWFEALRHEHDSIGSFERQSTVSTGLGYKFIENDNTSLTAQLGAGYKHFKQRAAAESDNNAIASGALELKQKLGGNVSLLDKVAVESGSDNTYIQNDLGFQVKMIDALALSLGHQIRYNTRPGPRAFGSGNYAHSDRLLTANLVYEFK